MWSTSLRLDQAIELGQHWEFVRATKFIRDNGLIRDFPPRYHFSTTGNTHIRPVGSLAEYQALGSSPTKSKAA